MILKIVALLLVVLFAAMFLFVRRWTRTPHGRLDARAAILPNLLGLE